LQAAVSYFIEENHPNIIDIHFIVCLSCPCILQKHLTNTVHSLNKIYNKS